MLKYYFIQKFIVPESMETFFEISKKKIVDTEITYLKSIMKRHLEQKV